MSEEPFSSKSNGRDAKGRFVKGWQGGPGRPKREVEVEYLSLLMTRVPYKKWLAIIDKAAELAAKGDYQARRWLTDYVVGPAAQSLHLRADLAGADLLAVLTQKLPDDERQALTEGEVWEIVPGEGD